MENINRPYAGLSKDTSVRDQPKGTSTFTMNAINETFEGDVNLISNEESNVLSASMKVGYIPLGKVYIGDGDTVIWSVSGDDTKSEIGILDKDSKYTTVVSDVASIDSDKLNFKSTHQIQGIYRLRGGCEKTIYFVDDLNPPRYLNFGSLEEFKNLDGTWDSKLFRLQKQYTKIPNIQNIEVLDSGGNLEPGSYNIAIQYVDNSLNPTEWITSTATIKVYNDFSNSYYPDISGSINSDSDYLRFPKTSKAIQVTVSNLDEDFLYYRLALIAANNGSGLINEVGYTDVIPVTKNFFIFTGTNTPVIGTVEEISALVDNIESAGSIHQVDNLLLLGKTTGKQLNYCKLQKYASRVKADLVTKNITLNDVNSPGNPKNPSVDFLGGSGYMPGEIYSYGLVYIFRDGTLSPTYHIPGKSPEVPASTMYEMGENTYPMGVDNQGKSSYTDNSKCSSSGDYWGRDSEGATLIGKPIRHHRFPLRSEVRLPLVVTEDEGEQSDSLSYSVNLEVVGRLIVPIPCPVGSTTCVEEVLVPFIIRANYTVSGEAYTVDLAINPQEFANEEGQSDVELTLMSRSHSSLPTLLSIVESTSSGEFPTTPGDPLNSPNFKPYSDPDNPSRYSSTIINSVTTVQGRVSRSDIFGIKFSGITMPSEEDLNGEEITGYYIVRNERTEFDKTILDSGVLLPAVGDSTYASIGLLNPDGIAKIEGVHGLIHPEHKFNGKEYVNYDKLIHQGNFDMLSAKYGKIAFDDVYDGSTFNSDKHKDGLDDSAPADGGNTSIGYDGWSMDIITRDNIATFSSANNFTYSNDDTAQQLEERFYLNALGNRPTDENSKTVYNLSSDNKVGVVKLEDGLSISGGNALPYVVMYKENLDPYSNFRVLPYYKVTENPVYFTDSEESSTAVFGGDSYISPMRYVTTSYWEDRRAYRPGKSGVLRIVIGALIATIGAALSAVTGGLTTFLVGEGIQMIGAGISIEQSGISIDAANKAYVESYDKGLKNTIFDDWVRSFYTYPTPGTTGDYGIYFTTNNSGQDGPSDDTKQWIGECVTDLWFESKVNCNLRNRMITDSTPTFLGAPGRVESGNNDPISTYKFSKGNNAVYYTNSNSERYPRSSFEQHLAKKLLVFDSSRDDNRYYLGLALGEYYNLNPDYLRSNKEKSYFHLALEYDCCSDCREIFSTRIRYSLQSFQEELSDNYRVLLPNNYVDLPGESGELVNLFKINNNLFVHTEEALWKMPRSYQERITDEIVSFIGTGSYFSVPPQKLLDDETGASAGLQHKWSAIKTSNGYFFVCENQRKIYQFTGDKLNPISSRGLNSWFKNNLEVQLDREFKSINGSDYTYRDNPSNPYGTGFITAYDTKKERLLVTKKDFSYNDGVITPDSVLCNHDNEVIIFNDFQQTIDEQEAQGWFYIGLEDCQMKFEKTELIQVEEEREVIKEIVPVDTIVVSFFDRSSLGTDSVNNLIATLDIWFEDFKVGKDNLTYRNSEDYLTTLWSTERWVKDVPQLLINEVLSDITDISKRRVLVLTFIDESNPIYHGNDFASQGQGMSLPTTDYLSDLNLFVGTLYPMFDNFVSLVYPLVGYNSVTQVFLLHTLAAIEARDMTQVEVDSLSPNPWLVNDGTDVDLKSGLMNNSYSSLESLRDYGWVYKEDRVNTLVVSPSGFQPTNDTLACPAESIPGTTEDYMINPCQFTADVNEVLKLDEGGTETETIIVIVQKEVVSTRLIGGVPQDSPVNEDKSWTLSYSLQSQFWVSWHSYMPNFYLSAVEKFYSWVNGNDGLWRHNSKGNYQTFYDVLRPHIVEYVSNSNKGLKTKVYDSLVIQTSAEYLDIDSNEYVEERYKTFNKAVLYNSRQCSGELNLVVQAKDTGTQDYLLGQVKDNGDSILSRRESDWTLNNFRDMRVDYLHPVWNSNISSLQDNYFIDKVLNELSIDKNKDWSQQERFRDKYLVVRLIFDKFADTKLITNYTSETEQDSIT